MLEIERALAPCSGHLRSTSREPQNLRRGATTGPQGRGAEVKAEVAHLSPRTEVGHMGDSGGPLGSAGRLPKSTEHIVSMRGGQMQTGLFGRTCNITWAHGVVVSHPLSMREALGSIPSVSIWLLQRRLLVLPDAATWTRRRGRASTGGAGEAQRGLRCGGTDEVPTNSGSPHLYIYIYIVRERWRGRGRG